MVVGVESDDDPLGQRDTSLVPRPRLFVDGKLGGPGNEAKGIPYIILAVGSYTSIDSRVEGYGLETQ